MNDDWELNQDVVVGKLGFLHAISIRKGREKEEHGRTSQL